MTLSRKAKQRQAERKRKAHEEARRQNEPLPSEFGFEQLDPGEERPIAIYTRVSTEKQEKHLAKQMKGLRMRLTQMGLTPVALFGTRKCEKGGSIDPKERKAFARALKWARKNKGVIVAVCFSRYLRNKWFHPITNSVRPTKEEIQAFVGWIHEENVAVGQIVTLNNPDDSPDADEKQLELVNRYRG